MSYDYSKHHGYLCWHRVLIKSRVHNTTHLQLGCSSSSFCASLLVALLLCMQRIAPPSRLCRRATMLPQRPVPMILPSVAAIALTHNSKSNEAGWFLSAAVLLLRCRAAWTATAVLLLIVAGSVGEAGTKRSIPKSHNIWNSCGRKSFNIRCSIFDAAMKLLSLAWGVLWVTHVASFLTPSPITARRSASVAVSSAAGLIPPSPDELKAKAAAIREEIKALEANASATNRPNADLVKPLPVRGQASDSQTLTNTSRLSQYPGCDHRSISSTGCTNV